MLVRIQIKPSKFLSLDLKVLQSRYTAMLQSFPDEFSRMIYRKSSRRTHSRVYLFNIYQIAAKRNTTLANKMMLDCVIVKICCKEGLLDFFNLFEKISGNPIWLWL